jgi:DNA-3-methyladenine glycosylase II
VKQVITHLKKDKKLSPCIRGEFPLLNLKKNIALRLVGSIMSQQLSTKVAAVIYQRFLELHGNKNPLPQDILKKSITELRSIGLSNQKAQYVHNVAQFFIDHKLTDAKIKKLSNEEALELLTQIKGIGRWTVEMILMFSLKREDVFAVDDYGIQMAMKDVYKLHKLEGKALKQKMIKISESWAPYRTYACLYLWRHKDQD